MKINYVQIRPYLRMVLVLTILLSLIWAKQNYLMMIMRSFLPQLSILLMVIGVWAFIKKARKTAIICALAAFAYMTEFIPLFESKSPPLEQAHTHSIKVMQANVLKFNKRKEETTEAILAQDADVIALQEINSKWEKKLKHALQEKYPYFHVHAINHSTTGLAVFSKFPLENIQIVDLDTKPAMVADVMANGQTLRLINLHLTAPVIPQGLHARNEEFSALKNLIKTDIQKTIVLGDFNTVPWDEEMKQLLTSSRVIHHRDGIMPTYPSKFPIARIPIDYILVDQHLPTQEVKRHDLPGSDHMALTAEIYLPNNMAQLKK